MYNLNDIFYEDAEYSARAEFANANGYMIKEIESDEHGRRFQFVEVSPPTEKESAALEIDDIKQKLFETDYQAIKFAEGVMTLSEYEPTREKRKQWRERINFLENFLKNS